MGKITFECRDDLEIGLRKKVSSEFGFHKGALEKALNEAVDCWIKEKHKK